jgi:hypothetical protein
LKGTFFIDQLRHPGWLPHRGAASCRTFFTLLRARGSLPTIGSLFVSWESLLT